MTEDRRQFPLSGQLFFSRQLHVLLAFVFSLLSFGEFKTRLL